VCGRVEGGVDGSVSTKYLKIDVGCVKGTGKETTATHLLGMTFSPVRQGLPEAYVLRPNRRGFLKDEREVGIAPLLFDVGILLFFF
jgi:hypothetical protein